MRQVFGSAFHLSCDKVWSLFHLQESREHEYKDKSIWKKNISFSISYMLCRNRWGLVSCEILRQFKYKSHICICPSNAKFNIRICTCTIGWTVILCTSCCAGSCTKLEATKLNPLKRWWALALGGTPGESVEGRKLFHELHKGLKVMAQHLQ